ncbi:2,3-bisphosphoglycerate-independent phosphoglycerate mutase [Mycena venus]|uniref:phosphoglycerate mutase (2,3-diphosphoglycerate-independent) n=1 Tax=Mycena venus TaxID=2733690 RepID=A0A8H7D3Q4_9AGAR|nr:2,3-bisphosphoglycerate-independent phosphoglycerate mutase [Mycena venus]
MATIVGRYYAMDRISGGSASRLRWMGLSVGGGGSLCQGKGAVDDIKANHEKDVTDESLKPRAIIVNGDTGRIRDGDTLFFFNYRSDHKRGLASVLSLPNPPIEVTVPRDLGITTMSWDNVDLPFSVAFPPHGMTNVVAGNAHVTFFNVCAERQFRNEERFMIPFPKMCSPLQSKLYSDKLV